MKKTKMSLSRSTLRNLSDAGLASVRGGDFTTSDGCPDPGTQLSECDCQIYVGSLICDPIIYKPSIVIINPRWR